MAGSSAGKHSPRFWRNSLISLLVLAACLASAFCARRSPLHLLWIVPLYYVGSLVLQTHRRVHPRLRRPRPRTQPVAPAPGYEPVEITGGDGLTLAGWYRPGDRQAAVIVAHAFRLNGTSMLGHARPLAERGFGVLLLDLRAHGRSQGDTSTPGWREAGDLLAAVDFLKGQVPRGPRQVGVLGISLGGQAALYAAAESNEIGAVVAEGPGPSGRRDLNIETSSLAGWLRNPIRQLSYALLVFMSGEQAAVGLTEAIQTISPRPVLLISAGQGHERSWLRRLARVAPEAVELWELPEAGHGGGLLAYPQLYGQKVASFFEASLPKGQS